MTATVVLSDAEFREVLAVIRELTGISMNESKRQLVERRLIGRIRALGLRSYRQYLELLRSGDATEIEQFSNAVTTNLTSFFRENHHFEFLSDTILPELTTRRANTRRLRIWSAGCSTGEEPYSIAMTLKRSLPDLAGWDAKILATDLDSNVLATCRTGVYPVDRLDKVEPDLVKRWFRPAQGEPERVQVRSEVAGLITFKQLNLMHQWPMKGPFDVIFCRNVIIYFDKPTQRVLIDRFADLLADDGYLIIGHSENLFKVSDRFRLLGQTIYRKDG